MFKKFINSMIFLLNQNKSFDDSVLTWEEARQKTTGYDNHEILNKVAASYLQSYQSPGLYERDSVVINDGLINWPLVGTIHWFLNNYSNEARVIDFGGSFASQYFQNREFLENINLKWSVVEQKNFVAAANKIVREKNLKFYEQINECLIQENPNIALFGSSLQYLEKPYQVLNEVTTNKLNILILDRIPMHQNLEDILVLQKVPKSIYDASYPAWIFSEGKLKTFIQREFKLVNVYNSVGGCQKTKSGNEFCWKGHIYLRKVK